MDKTISAQSYLYATGIGSYGTGFALQVIYPSAQGRYVSYFGEKGFRTMAYEMSSAIAKSSLTQDLIDRIAAPISDPSLIAKSPISQLGNNAMMDAA